jgi:hypothetical protein
MTVAGARATAAGFKRCPVMPVQAGAALAVANFMTVQVRPDELPQQSSSSGSQVPASAASPGSADRTLLGAGSVELTTG